YDGTTDQAKISSTSGLIVVHGIKGGGGTTSGDINNRAGANAIATGDRWILYLSSPANNLDSENVPRFGALDSSNLPIWGQTIDTLVPGVVPAGNRYVFANTPILTLSTTLSDSKTYGDVYTFSAPVQDTNYTLGSFVN